MSANRRAVRRWLHKALEGWAADLVVGPDGDPVAKPLPEWALTLHQAGAWRYMTQRHVRYVHFNPDVQDALLAANRVGGTAAMLAVLAQHIGVAHANGRQPGSGQGTHAG